MPYSQEIAKGLNYIRSILNPDGGVPATKPGDPSGCWTSAESLEIMLTAGVHHLDPRPVASALIAFLVANQIGSGADSGGWPLVAGGRQASAMATGHAVAALSAARRFFAADASLLGVLSPALTAGMAWLEAHKGSERGWGVEPTSGGDGAQLRMISTVYALRGYVAVDRTAQNSGDVNQACQAILSLQNRDGGFCGKKGLPSDACNTSRAIVALLSCKALRSSDRVIQRAVSYLCSQKPRSGVWQIDTESYVTQSAPGQTVFNSNTPADAIEALLSVGRYDKLVSTSLLWLVGSQNDDGSWCLASSDKTVPDVVSWPTNEAMFSLALASRVFKSAGLPGLQHSLRRSTITLALISIFCIAEGVILIFTPQLLQQVWSATPEWLRSLVVGGLVLALFVNLLAAYLWDRFKGRN
ncbi:MAG: prenyltransferase/squalene oxidase repeat-containing protein [Bryobacteraceae bacterium]